ncbi:MAG: hypothetical protein HYV97_14100 [Bdellovibrio sp.]|nr:hypothetical protein [Bdellovibrio sp.]
MTTQTGIGRKKLNELPSEVARLVNSGVYSLYGLKDHAEASFVLITDMGKIYLVSATGCIFSEIKSLTGLEITTPVFVEEQKVSSMLKVNYA